MTSADIVDHMFAAADTNRDGRIDANEFRNLLKTDGTMTIQSYEPSVTREIVETNPTHYERYRYRDAVSTDWATEVPIKSSGIEETNRYLRRLGSSVYVDPNPRLIRKTATDHPITYEQRVFLRCLQPPPLPAAEPLIIKEVRPEQPPLPPPVVIRERGVMAAQPPPLILRERPPVPPPRLPGQTIIRHLPPVPLPPRSLIIERFPDMPEKPRDIIIERWLPYPADATERREIVQRAPPPPSYPAPTHTVYIYDSIPSHIVRKIERLGVFQEDPDAYLARYGATLLDRDTLLQQARSAGVLEDISCAIQTSSPVFSVYGRSTIPGITGEIRTGYHLDEPAIVTPMTTTTTTIGPDGEVIKQETQRYS